MDKLVSLTKRRGFIFAGSGIYGGLANSWDYGPLGVELKNNIKQQWWKKFVQQKPDIVGIDTAILMNSAVWKASGHLQNFSDPLIDCKNCKHRFRADKLLEEGLKKMNIELRIEGMKIEDMQKNIEKHKINCPQCGIHNFTNVRHFNLMFKTFQGVDEEQASQIFLRPETAQGIFVNTKNIQTTTRKKLPFGIAQIGKSFRNEITPGNFIFRTREFEQMEIEYFCNEPDVEEYFQYWENEIQQFLLSIGLKKENFRFRKHEQQELSHYSRKTTDVEFLFPFGWGELWGIAHRGDYDLNCHQQHSGKELSFSGETNETKYLPHCIEPSVGVERLFLSLLINSYTEETVNNEQRVFLNLAPSLAPIKIAIFPLAKKLTEETKKYCINYICTILVN